MQGYPMASLPETVKASTIRGELALLERLAFCCGAPGVAGRGRAFFPLANFLL